MRGDQYAVALGLLHCGQVVLGVLGCPNLPMASIANGMEPAVASGENVGCLFAARLGAGTWVEALEGGGVSKQVGGGWWKWGLSIGRQEKRRSNLWRFLCSRDRTECRIETRRWSCELSAFVCHEEDSWHLSFIPLGQNHYRTGHPIAKINQNIQIEVAIKKKVYRIVFPELLCDDRILRKHPSQKNPSHV